jgi:hypothetical protein
MNQNIKNIAIIINFLILLFSILWIKKTDFEYEPITVFLGQMLSLMVLFFGDAIQSKFSIKDVSDSKVKIDTSKKDNSEYDISNIKDNSEVNIKKN